MKKKVILVVLAMVTVLSFGICVAANWEAEDIRTATVGTCNITAKNQIALSTAKASVSLSQSASAGVEATYYHINDKTTEVKTVNRVSGGQYGASVSFTAPENCRTVKIISDFSVNASGQKWSTNITTIR